MSVILSTYLDGTGSTALKRVSDVMVIETWCTRAISRSVPVPGLLFQSEELSEAPYEIRVASHPSSGTVGNKDGSGSESEIRN
jgi:hypothetical protein